MADSGGVSREAGEAAADIEEGPYKVDFLDDGVHEWHAVDGGVEHRVVDDYSPSVYVASESTDDLLRHLEGHPDVLGLGVESWRRGFRHEAEDVLRVDVDGVDRVRSTARIVSNWGEPREHELFDVDLSPEFRYCLDRGLDPTPERRPEVLELRTPEAPTRTPVARLDVDGCRVEGAEEVVEAVDAVLDRRDPDVLVVDSGALLPKLGDTAEAVDRRLQLGRLPGLQKRAERSRYESFGKVCHSPRRFNVPGRAVVDLSNTFLYGKTGLHGCLDLVERSRKPLQELSWASIGNVLTSMQVCEARNRDVLVPWRSWRHERFKPMSTLHESDRGGTTFSPDVGVHRDVHELDFASLYPNIMVTRNVSPEKVLCSCHPDRSDVPTLGYNVCRERGYLPDLLERLVEDRQEYKRSIAEVDDEAALDELEGRSDAIKWILVSCFGYQGFKNAKFGRIECHESINAYAREMLVEAKRELEDAGWRVVHGIVDSIWVKPRRDDPEPLEDVAARVSDDVDIPLEYEGAFDWIAFVPRRDGGGGALNRYFGSRRDGEFKLRGVECRQRSTTGFVEEFQRDAVEALDRRLEPEAVCGLLERRLRRLEDGDVAPDELVVTRRVSKQPEEYSRMSASVGAMERARGLGVDVYPGEDVRFVVVDDSAARYRERVRLSFEDSDGYDSGFYRRRLLKVAESLVSPFGWGRDDLERRLASTEPVGLSAF